MPSTSLDNAPLDPQLAIPLDGPLAIRVENLHKSFRIPTHKVDSLKERVVRPFSSRDYRVLNALENVSFDVRRGEFFGIVGRNGSGKSTLLKLLASIYRPDAGRILMAGRLAPFIELGVGFNPELSARENIVLNGVMMGLTPQEARYKMDAVLEFAELQDFVDLKLKNYSSGMLVRLAFSLMLEVDADILLIDEVLAVGDAAFQQKCEDAFHEMKDAGKTIILVTHGMEAVETYCHRALLIHDSKIEYVGDPSEVGRRYLDINFRTTAEIAERSAEGDELRFIDAWAENQSGERVGNFEHPTPIHMRLRFEARIDSPGLNLGLIVNNNDGIPVVQFGAAIDNGGRDIHAGEVIEIKVKLGNPFAPGRHFVSCGVNRTLGGVAAYVQNALEFVIYGGPSTRGVIYLPHDVTTTVSAGD